MGLSRPNSPFGFNTGSEQIQLLIENVTKRVPFYRGRSKQLLALPIVQRGTIADDPVKFVDTETLPLTPRIVKWLHSGLGSPLDEVQIDKGVLLEQTSGSSGRPLRFLRTMEERAALALGIWRYRKSLDPQASTKNFDALIHNPRANAADINLAIRSTENDDRIMAYLGDRNLRWIHANPKILKCFASIVSAQTNPVSWPGLRYAESSGKLLSKSEWTGLEKTLKIIILNQYGTRETWAIGYGSGGGEFEALTDNVIVEIVDKFDSVIEEPFAFGRIVVTSLHQKRFPFLRYDTGDVGAWIPGPSGFQIKLAPHREHEILKGTIGFQLGSEIFKSILISVNKRMGYPTNRKLKIDQRAGGRFIIYADAGLANEQLRFLVEQEFNKLSLLPVLSTFVLCQEVSHQEVLSDSKEAIFSSASYEGRLPK